MKNTRYYTEVNKTMSITNPASLWFGYSLEFWNSLGLWLLILAVCAGAITAVAGGLSSYISSSVTSIVQRSAEERIASSEQAAAEANAVAEKARESAAMAQERAARLEKEAAQARVRAAMLERQLLELRRASRRPPF
jgi:ATPase subunit of ABC transporter with duplicated ATPase domains